jgi:cytoskeletal protein RodZ
MVDSSKNQLGNASLGESGDPFTRAASSRRPERWTRTNSRLAITALIVVFGLGVGWIAGKFITRSSVEPSQASEVSAGIDSNAPSQAESGARGPANHESGSETSTSPSQETSASPPQFPLVPAPPAVESATPPRVPRVQKEEEPAVEPPTEESAKEVGPEALKKISKEIKKMHRGKPLGKNNANEDGRQ